jgi:hypothetical protein
MTAYQLFQLPKATPIASGVIVPGARVSFFLTTTSTPTPVYTTSVLSTTHTQPVEADAAGVLPPIYLDPTITYKATVNTAADVLIYTVDPVNDSLLSAALIGLYLYPQTTAEQSAGVTPVNYAFPPGDLRRYGTNTTPGTTVLTAAIQAAIDQCNAGGAAVYVPPVVHISGPLTFNSNLTIYGDGPTSIIKLAASSNDHLLVIEDSSDYTDNITIKDVCFDGNKANNATSGVGLYLNGRHYVLDNVTIQNTVQAGLLIGVPSGGVANTPLAGDYRISNLYCYNCAESNTWGAIGVTHGKNMLFTNINVLSDDGGMTYGFDVEPESGNTCDDIRVDNMSIVGGRLFLDGANLGGTTFATNLALSNIHVDARGSYNPSDIANVAPMFLRQVKGLLGTNITLIGHDTRTYGGIYCEDAGATTTFTVEDMHLTNVKITNAATASRSGYFSEVRNSSLMGYQLDVSSSSNGMEFPNSTGIRVGGGSIINNAGAGPAVNIGATAADIQFDETCRFTGTVTVNATAYANGCEVRRILSGSATWDPASIADGDEAETTVTVTGAALGDFVDACSFSIDVADLGVSAAVSATDTVAVSLLNNTGGAVDLASSTVRVRVLKVA